MNKIIRVYYLLLRSNQKKTILKKKSIRGKPLIDYN